MGIMTFAEKLKRYRILNDYSSKEIATLIGVSPSTYSRYESGKSQPNTEKIKKIAGILDIDVEYFLKDDLELVLVIEKPA